MESSLEISADELERYRASARASEAERQRDLEAYRTRALTAARSAARMLRLDFGATRVVLFGSLARRSAISMHTDADLAAEGIPNEMYFTAVGRLQTIDPLVSIDLVRVEDAPGSLIASLESEGLDL